MEHLSVFELTELVIFLSRNDKIYISTMASSKSWAVIGYPSGQNGTSGSGLQDVPSKKTFSPKPRQVHQSLYNINPSLTKMARYWPRSWTLTLFWSINIKQKITWPMSSYLDQTSLIFNPDHTVYLWVVFWVVMSLSLTELPFQYLTETWKTEAPLLWRIKRENWTGKEDAKGFWRTAASKTSHGTWSTISSRLSALTSSQ